MENHPPTHPSCPQDTTPPATADFVAALTVECSALPSTALAATDACDAAPQVLFSQTRTDGRCAGVYTLARNWTLVDNCGNAAQLVQTLTVQDTRAPRVVGVPGRATAECSAVPAAAVVTGSDNCDAGPSVALVETRIGGGCAFNYTLNRTWTVTDACGNSNASTQLIEVWDTTPPTVTVGPQNATVECDGAGNTAQLSAWLDAFGGAQATDACSGSGAAGVTWTHNFGSGSQFVAGCGRTGTYVVTFTATDQCGLSTSRVGRFTIAVRFLLSVHKTLIGAVGPVVVLCIVWVEIAYF